MLRKYLLFVCTLTIVLLLIGADTSRADILGSYNIRSGNGTRNVDTVWLTYAYIGDWQCRLFNDIPLIANIGKTFWITSDQQDADFAEAVSYLTNGTSDPVCVMCDARFIGVGIPTDERDAFFGGTGGPDFAGKNVGAIGLRVNDATAVSPGEDPNGDGIWTDYTYDLTLLVATGVPVPEPASVLVLGSFVGGCWLKRRRTLLSRR